MNKKSNDKPHYFLQEAAERLKCSTTELLHFGATGVIKMAVYFRMIDKKIHTTPYDIDTFVIGYSGLYYVQPEDIEKLEYGYKEAPITYFFPTTDAIPLIYGYKTCYTGAGNRDNPFPYRQVGEDSISLNISLETILVIKNDFMALKHQLADKAAKGSFDTTLADNKKSNKGGKPQGALSGAVEHAYTKLLRQGDTGSLRAGEIGEFLSRLKEMASEGHRNKDDYILERIEKIKNPKVGACTITTKERHTLHAQRTSIEPKRDYDKNEVSKILTALMKKCPLPN